MNDNHEYELTRGARVAGNLIAGGYTVLCGIFLLLVGLGVMGGLTIKSVALPSILLTIGLAFFTTALVQRNPVSLWLSFAFIVPALVTYLSNFTALGYRELYPLYIAIPAIASLFTMLYTRAFKDHIGVIAFFGLIAAAFALESSGLVGWGVALPVLLVFFGLFIVYTAVKLSKSEDDNE